MKIRHVIPQKHNVEQTDWSLAANSWSPSKLKMSKMSHDGLAWYASQWMLDFLGHPVKFQSLVKGQKYTILNVKQELNDCLIELEGVSDMTVALRGDILRSDTHLKAKPNRGDKIEFNYLWVNEIKNTEGGYSLAVALDWKIYSMQ